MENEYVEIFGKKLKKTWVIALMFLVLTVIIMYMFPSNAKVDFENEYELGEVWRKEDLKAAGDFVIYKDERSLKAEIDSTLMANYQPYFKDSSEIINSVMPKIMGRTSTSSEVADLYTKHIVKQIRNIYQSGIMSTEDYDRFKDSVKAIRVFSSASNDAKASIQKRLASADKDKPTIYTPKTAYQRIIKTAPASLDISILKKYDLDKLLIPNLFYDAKRSEMSRMDIVNKISTTKGTVSQGETIIASGKKINRNEYDKINSYRIYIEQNGSSATKMSVKIGQFLVVLAALITFFLYLTRFRAKFAKELKNVLFMLMMICALCGVTSFVVYNFETYIYVIPFALLPIVTTAFFDTRTALFMHNTTVLICSVIIHAGAEFLLMQVVIGMLTICTLNTIYERQQLVRCALYVLAAYCLLYIGCSFIYSSRWITTNNLMDMVYSVCWDLRFFVFNFFLLLIAYPIIYIIEKIFGFTSDVTLVELANTNNPLLRQFSESAQGSFEHSIRVSNLADAVAQAVGASPLLVRTGALYHDIGKLKDPIYFTENQRGVNPHNEIDDNTKSAQIIISHVAYGLELAEKNGLPEKIKAFIRTHHGVNQAKYFYTMEQNKNPEVPLDPTPFTYPGPRPDTKETAILMMCDSVEAASRSVKEFTEENITNLVNKIIDGQVQEGAFIKAPITFAEIDKIKHTMIEKLKSMYHTRISYPELKKKKQ